MTDVTGRDVDGGWAWVVLPAVALNLALQDAFLVSVGIFQVEFLQSFSGSQGFVALICAFASGGQVIFGPVAGIMADLLTHRVTVMIGAALKGVALLLASFSQDLPTLLLLYGLLAGAGAGLCYTPTITVISIYFHKYRTAANGLTLAAPGIGLLIGPYLLRWLIDGYGWRYAMAVFGGLMAQICVLAAVFYPLAPGNLRTLGCCTPCGRPPSRDDPAPENSRTMKDARIFRPSDNDLSRTEQDVKLGSRTKLQVKDGSRTELRVLLGSRSELGVKTGSGTDLTVKTGSRTNLEVKAASVNDLEAKAGSRTELNSRPLSMRVLQVSDFGSAMLNQSVECLRKQEPESTPLSFRERVTRLLCHKFIWIICLNQLLMMCGHAINVVLYAAFAQSVGAAFEDIPALYTAYGVTISVARVAGGFAFSAIPERLTHAFLGLQVALAAVFGFLPVYGVSLPGLFAGIVMVGMTYGPSYMLLSPIILRYVALSDLSIAYGLVMLSCGIAFLLAPTVAGITYDISHSYSASYYIAGSTVAAGSLPLLLLLFMKDLELPQVKDDGEDRLLSTNQKNGDVLARDSEDETANKNVCHTSARDSKHEAANDCSCDSLA